MSVLPSSVLQDTAHHKVSDKYTHINTTLIIDKLLNNGFELYEAKEANVRKVDNMGYQKHLVTLKYSELETSEGVPTVVISDCVGVSTVPSRLPFNCVADTLPTAKFPVNAFKVYDVLSNICVLPEEILPSSKL